MYLPSGSFRLSLGNDGLYCARSELTKTAQVQMKRKPRPAQNSTAKANTLFLTQVRETAIVPTPPKELDRLACQWHRHPHPLVARTAPTTLLDIV